jgi:hypothetical protein
MMYAIPTPANGGGQDLNADLILELPAEAIIRDDPREALFNDYHDQVRSAAGTLAAMQELDLLPQSLERKDWWGNFVDVIVNNALAELEQKITANLE